MWNKPTEKQLAKLPAFYATEDVQLEDKKVRMHFFLGGCDWWAVEYDPEERKFFGYVNLNDPDMAEWGYFSLDELLNLRVKYLQVDRDLHWTPVAFKDIFIASYGPAGAKHFRLT